jgi:site-specific DNA-methyltransferase (adenine-specific)
MGKLLNSDAETELSRFKNQVDFVFFDPPYGIGNKKLSHKDKNWKKSDEDWDQFESIEEQYQSYLKWLTLIKEAMKDTGNLFLCASFHNLYLCGEILQRQLGMKIVNSIVWYKDNAMFNITQSGLIESTEHLIWAVKSKDYYFNYEASKTFAQGKQLRNVWTSSITPTSERVGHPHQKPIWLVQRCLEIGCPKGGFVLDPMCGSGTTAVACEGLGLDYLCVEKNQEYFEQAKGRLSNSVNIFNPS